MKIAIQGVGVAGPTLAYWLHRFGHEPVLIEKAAAPRNGGYVIDCWRTGYDLVEKMGLLEPLRATSYLIHEIRWVNANGKQAATYNPDMLRALVNDRFITIERSELAAAILDSVKNKVEILFGDSIVALEQHADRVDVEFEQAAPASFDLVIGADGLHSTIRQLVFGPMEHFEHNLGMRVAALELDQYKPREELLFISHTEPGRQLSRLSKHDDKTLFLFGLRDRLAASELPKTDEAKRAELRRAFANMGWECPQVLAALDSVHDIYYDSASQIKMDQWSQGRVALVGDAVACPSLLSGEGTGMGMLEAYVLAGELALAKGDYKAAFARYQQMLMPLLKRKQKNALKFAATFLPDSKLPIFIRDAVTRVLPGKLVARLAMAGFNDNFELPPYA